jgi:hypothetical protein
MHDVTFPKKLKNIPVDAPHVWTLKNSVWAGSTCVYAMLCLCNAMQCNAMQRSDANTLSPLPGILRLTYWNVPQNVPQNVLDLFVPPRVPQRRGGVSVLLDPLNVICLTNRNLPRPAT